MSEIQADTDEEMERVEEDATSSAAAAGRTSLRRRGRRPADATERKARVQQALDDLRSARVPFSMADVAERAGVSRATLYRDADLRLLIGSQGDGPVNRPVDASRYDKLSREVADLSEERKRLRRELRRAEARVRAAEKRVAELADEAVDHERARRVAEAAARSGDAEKIRSEAYAEGFNAGVRAALGSRGGGGAAGGPAGRAAGAGGAASANLIAAAARLPRPALQVARRKLARVLHPDLFAKDDPATALLATELLKQINNLAGGGSGG